tara:strand:+ start:1312 stop:1662 length:351 start_codon:yes stop_codon:yes gene_type:complete
MKPTSFSIRSEADCERVAKVFVQWLQDRSPQLKKRHTVVAPSDIWAHLFSDIYTDELCNNNLADIAEKNIIQVEFNITNEEPLELDNTDILNLLQDFLDSFGKPKDNKDKDNDWDD